MGKSRLARTLITTMLCLVLVAGQTAPTFAAKKIHYQDWLASCVETAQKLEKYQFKFFTDGNTNKHYEKVKKMAKSRRVANCSDYVAWSLQTLGLFKSGQHFWGDSYRIRGRSANYVKYSGKFKVIKVPKAPRANTLAKNGVLKPGDIVSQVDGSGNHLQIYAGMDKKGKPIFYAVGKKWQIVNGHFNAKRILTTKLDKRRHHANPRVGLIVRIKGLIYTDTYKVTTSVSGGTITKSKAVKYKNDFTVKYSPSEGYVLKSVTVNGKAVSIKKYPSSYTFKSVKKKQSIKVVYQKKKLAVTAAAENGTITGGTGTVEYGSTASVSFRPDEGYTLSKVLDGDTDVTARVSGSDEAGYTYTIGSVKAAHSIRAVFEKSEEDPKSGAGEEAPDSESVENPDGSDVPDGSVEAGDSADAGDADSESPEDAVVPETSAETGDSAESTASAASAGPNEPAASAEQAEPESAPSARAEAPADHNAPEETPAASEEPGEPEA